MKKLLLSILVFSTLSFLGCLERKVSNESKENALNRAKKANPKMKSKDSIMEATIDTVLLKDINNDKINDTAFVYTPQTFASFDDKGNIEYQMGCVDNNCFNKITFSCNLPEMVFKESVWGRIENAGDLNGDGISELLFMPDWFTSTMGRLYLYSFRNGKWKEITSVPFRKTDESLLPYLIHSKGKYYLRGVDFSNDEKPYKTEIKFTAEPFVKK